MRVKGSQMNCEDCKWAGHICQTVRVGGVLREKRMTNESNSYI